jgi:acetyl-CoA carboxylase biotin carboxyl carrier protein
MNDPVLLVRVETDGDGMTRVLAPRVGWWTSLPGPGTLIGPGSDVGALDQLNRRFRLMMPEGAAGLVADGLPALRGVAVEYGQLLFRLTPVGAATAADGPSGQTALRQRAGEQLAADTRAIVSPTDGVFYRKPSPDAAAFVEVGSRVRRGQPVGLVEVMKTFNQILYDGPGVPEEAEVVEVRAGDSEEVGAGQILIVVR